MNTPQKILGTFSLAMISVSAILSLRGLPMMASLGWQAIFFYGLAALTFLIPGAFICAELATSLPKNGGVFTWVSAAFGAKVGFLAIWMEWINNVIAFPATLATIVTTIAYIGFPSLADDRYSLFCIMMVIYWACTFFNLLGIRAASWLSVAGALLGTLLPGAFIIILGLSWWLSGKPIAFLHSSFLPEANIGSVALYVSVLGAYAGMQVTAFHAQNVKNPQKNFPRAILLASILIFVLSNLGALSIASVMPSNSINLMNGVIEAFSDFFVTFHLSAFTPVLAALIAFGGIASMNAWIISPARGLLQAAEEGHLPKILARSNQHGMPTSILWLQGMIGTLLALVFLFMPSLSSAFWLLVALTGQFTVLMYVLLFASAIRLRFSQPELPRPYKIPGGNWLISILGTAGIISSAIGFYLALYPPSDLHIVNESTYLIYIIFCDAVILGIPLLWLGYRYGKA